MNNKNYHPSVLNTPPVALYIPNNARQNTSKGMIFFSFHAINNHNNHHTTKHHTARAELSAESNHTP